MFEKKKKKLHIGSLISVEEKLSKPQLMQTYRLQKRKQVKLIDDMKNVAEENKDDVDDIK